MKKKLLPLAIATAMTPGFAAAADVSGFVDIIYTITDESADVAGAKNANEGKFATSGEIDFSASPADGVTVRLDVDVANSFDSTVDDTVNLEQAFFAWGATDSVTVIGGVFNNPIGYEAQDAPDMWGTSYGAVFEVLDGQTELYSNNVAGLAVATDFGPVAVTAAMLNDLQETNEENSFALVANASPIEGLDLELGFVTQADQSDNMNSTEEITNFNVAYSPEQVAGLTVGLDYLTAGKIVDSAHDIWVGYDFDYGITAKVRLSDIDYANDSEDTDATTFYVSYQVASNLSAAIEHRTESLGDSDTDTTQLELIATF